METIFISIASYRDPELLPTLRDCLANAKNPKRLKFGICWQKDDTESLEEFTDGLNKSSLVINNCAVFEPAVVGGCTISKPVQMIRKGYYILDKDSTDDRLVFNKTVSLKEGYKITKGV